MIGKRAATVAVMATTLGLAGAMQLGAQDPPTRVLQEQQMMRLQAQATQLNEAIKQMQHTQERAHLLEQQLVQQMTQLREHPPAPARAAVPGHPTCVGPRIFRLDRYVRSIPHGPGCGER